MTEIPTRPAASYRSAQLRDLLGFTQSFARVGGRKLAAVLGLEMILKSINGVGLLLILPLLGLLGIGSAPSDNPVWRKLVAALERVGLGLNLELGLILFVGVITFRALLNWRRTTWQEDVEQKFQMSLRIRLYDALARTELYYLQQLRSSDFLQSTQIEIRNTQRAANVLAQIVSDVLNLTIYFTIALLLSWQMTTLVFVCGGISTLILLPFVRRTHTVSSRLIRNTSKMLNNVLEHIQGVRIARTLGLTGKFVDDFRRRCQEAAHATRELTGLKARSTLIFEVVSVILLAIIVYAALTRFEVEAARLLVLLAIFIRIFPSIGVFQNQVQQFVSLVPSFNHYRELLERLQRHEEVVILNHDAPPLRLQRALELRDVSFSYHRAGQRALRNITLSIERGAINVISGRSGAGKSTLADIATGLLPPQTGELLLDGRPLAGADRFRWRQETAVVPQEGFLFNDTLRANLLCVKPTATEAEFWAVLEAVNARGFVETRRRGLDSVVGERGNLLSGGERQRISIARALLRRPQLLVLDEPTNNLDRESEQSVLEVLEKLKDQTTLLVISHNERLLERADRAFHLEDGSLVNHRDATISDTSRPGTAI